MNLNDIRRDENGKVCEIIEQMPKSGIEANGPQLITLKGLADPTTLEFYSYETPMVITEFDVYGQPILTEEQYTFCLYQANDLKRRTRKLVSLKFVVKYYEQKFTVPRREFDSLPAIQAATKNLFTLENLIHNRQRFYRLHGMDLHEFLLFSYIKLDKKGEVLEARGRIGGSPAFVDVEEDVVEFDEDFIGDGFDEIEFKENRALIPKAGSLCPYCGRPITIDCVSSRSETRSHQLCYTRFRNMTEYDRFCEIIYPVYPDCSKNFPTKLESGYRRYHFGTLDGHITLDSTLGKGRVRIAWHEDYMPFDKSKLSFHVWKEGSYLVAHADDDGVAIQRLREVKSNIIR